VQNLILEIKTAALAQTPTIVNILIIVTKRPAKGQGEFSTGATLITAGNLTMEIRNPVPAQIPNIANTPIIVTNSPVNAYSG
jgi:hypothetical protein